MAVRISQSQMYSSYMYNMNTTLADLMTSSEQSTTQKRINRPSDDPAGMANVLMYRQSLDNISQYQSNIKTATGWLGVADSTLLDVQNLLSEIKTYAAQGATGHMTPENRQQISFQIREYFQQMIEYANKSFNGQYIFAGTNTQTQPFVEALYAHSNDPALEGAEFVVTGGADYTTVVQITGHDGVTPPTYDYSYSTDGGDTWIDGNSAKVMGNSLTLQCGGAQVVIPAEYVTDSSGAPTIPGADKEDSSTWLYIRPSAVYTGNTNSATSVQGYSSKDPSDPLYNPVSTSAVGTFSRDISVRIDSVSGTEINYSYSVDNGSNWIEVTVPSGTEMLPIPGCFLKIYNGTLSGANVGDQFNVCPSRADINMEIGMGQTVTVNSVGSEIFGGLIDGQPVNGGDSSNIFEVLGRLISALETNDQDSVGAALEELDVCMNVVLSKAAQIGGRENRLTAAMESLTWRSLDETDAMSAIEDVDYVTLLTNLEKQQLAYNTVLKASSMIMQLSLLNYM